MAGKCIISRRVDMITLGCRVLSIDMKFSHLQYDELDTAMYAKEYFYI